jgi:hypothetical protein
MKINSFNKFLGNSHMMERQYLLWNFNSSHYLQFSHCQDYDTNICILLSWNSSLINKQWEKYLLLFGTRPAHNSHMEQTGWNYSNAVDLYLGGTWFKSLLRHWLSWLRGFVWISSVPPAQCRNSTSVRKWQLPSKSFQICVIYHLTILRISSVIK